MSWFEKTNHLLFFFNKLKLFSSKLIVSKIVVKFSYGVGFRDVEFGYAE